ncbi:hypothetical protein CPter91_1926 [Collimonas pratensis]|uniref:ASCH domain-containing protein n=2 Tax=Collimonas pratensis TaxID=279113 RepID=A0A127Q2J2_9BURK|nr:hypothetical protein CPter91_1926 [Collimonas pratensis]
MVTDGAILPWDGDPAALLRLLQQSKRPCPYGQPGDRHWVRETFVAFGRWETRFSDKKKRDEWHFVDMTLDLGLAYRFDGAALSASRRNGPIPEWHNRPSIFMPRAASRILLDITDVRVERLNDISCADARAEGAETYLYECYDFDYKVAPELANYRRIWESLYGTGSWDANPWVWVVEFRRITDLVQ